MIVWLALSTQTPPSAWWDEDDATIQTAVRLVEQQAEQIEQSR